MPKLHSNVSGRQTGWYDDTSVDGGVVARSLNPGKPSTPATGGAAFDLYTLVIIRLSVWGPRGAVLLRRKTKIKSGRFAFLFVQYPASVCIDCGARDSAPCRSPGGGNSSCHSAGCGESLLAAEMLPAGGCFPPTSCPARSSLVEFLEIHSLYGWLILGGGRERRHPGLTWAKLVPRWLLPEVVGAPDSSLTGGQPRSQTESQISKFVCCSPVCCGARIWRWSPDCAK